MNETIKSFVMQDATKLVGALPVLTQKFMQTATNVASFLDNLLYGAGLMQNYKVIHNKFGGSLIYL